MRAFQVILLAVGYVAVSFTAVVVGAVWYQRVTGAQAVGFDGWFERLDATKAGFTDPEKYRDWAAAEQTKQRVAAERQRRDKEAAEKSSSGEITDFQLLYALKDVIDANGYFCARIIGAWASGQDEFGNQVRIVCPGDSLSGTRFRVSVNPLTRRATVRLGW